MKLRTKPETKKKRFNTIETDDDWDEKEQRRRATIHRYTNHDQGYYMSSLDQSIQTYSTKNNQRKTIKFSYSQKEQSRLHTQKNTTQKKKSQLSVSKSKSKQKTQQGVEKQDRKKSSHRARSGSIGNNKRPKESPKKSEIMRTQQSAKPAKLDVFETFEPKETFLEGYIPGKKLVDESGCLIWRARCITNHRTFFVKEAPSPHEIELFEMFFLENGRVRRQFAKSPYVSNLPKLLKHTWDDSRTGSLRDVWMVFENNSEQPLQNQLYRTSLRGNVLQVGYLPLHEELASSAPLAKRLILQISKVLSLLSDRGVVHGQLRPWNIFVKTAKDAHHHKTLFTQVKVFGFENWFYFKDFQRAAAGLVSQYTPPEILNYLLFDSGSECDRTMLNYLEDYPFSWVFDIWALGMLLLELLVGYPLSMRPEVIEIGREPPSNPIFSPTESAQSLIEKQLEIVYNLDRVLTSKSDPPISRNVQLQYLVKRMLSIDPRHRISPAEIVHMLK